MIQTSASALRGKSVFVTGHTGFKGSWASLWLARLGANVTGYSLEPPTEPSNFAVSGVADVLAGHYQADIRDAANLSAAIEAGRPDVVLHMAAQALVREGYRSPRETFDVNVVGTAGLLDAIRAAGRPCVVILITSDKCYENLETDRGYREDDRLGGQDPYSASKGAQELVAAAYRRSFFPPEQLSRHGVKLATVRAGNVIGGGDWAPDRIVTDIVTALSTGRPVPVRNPGAVRPWQHVLEPLDGYFVLAARMLKSDDPKWCSAWNFGPAGGTAMSVRELVEQFCAAWGEGTWEDCSDPDAPPEAHLLQLNVDKVGRELGWRPRWDVRKAVARTARWYKRFHEGAPAMHQACEEDIAAYEGSRAEGGEESAE